MPSDASHFDRLELSIDPARAVAWPGGGGFQPVVVRVNGVELLELVRRVERPFAESEFDARLRGGETEAQLGPRGDLAGRYLYPPASLTLLPSRNLLGAPYDHGFVLDAD